MKKYKLKVVEIDEERPLTTVGEDFCFSCKTQLKYRKFYKLYYVSFKVTKNEKQIPYAIGIYRGSECVVLR